MTVGWTGSLGRATYGFGGYPASVIVDPGGATGVSYAGGSGLFTGVGVSSVATQTVSLAASAAAIDNGNVDALLSVHIGGYASQDDNAEVRYDFRDASGTVLASVTYGPVMAADRGSVSGFVHFSGNQQLPVGTRDAVVTITTELFLAPANDGYVDNVSLILDAPSPVANPDTVTTTQGVPVTLSPYADDVPGAGAAIVPASVRLLDGTGTPVTTLTTTQGLYTVDTATGDVEFAPVPSFSGTTPPVPYRITDSSGQIADSILTVTVDVVTPPVPGTELAATGTDPMLPAIVAGALLAAGLAIAVALGWRRRHDRVALQAAPRS